MLCLKTPLQYLSHGITHCYTDTKGKLHNASVAKVDWSKRIVHIQVLLNENKLQLFQGIKVDCVPLFNDFTGPGQHRDGIIADFDT